MNLVTKLLQTEHLDLIFASSTEFFFFLASTKDDTRRRSSRRNTAKVRVSAVRRQDSHEGRRWGCQVGRPEAAAVSRRFNVERHLMFRVSAGFSSAFESADGALWVENI